ncbi:MAG: hypothetical protein HGJ94_13850 [Desulfosarcina sp.]|nr:hypothetical protein [Desulfosarcina sp.]
MQALNRLLKLQPRWGLGVIPAQAGIHSFGNPSNFPANFPDIHVAALSRSKFIILTMRSVLLLSLLQLLCGCMSIMYYEGSYHGKVIDSQTLKPIEEAVVLGVWSKGYPGAGGVAHEYYDAHETVTDKNGEFTIKGMGPRAMTYLEKMDIVIFKAGYEDVGLTSWESLKIAIYYRNRVKWEGSKAIIPLDKWSMDQRRKRFDVSVVWVPKEKQKMLLEEIKKEKNEI